MLQTENLKGYKKLKVWEKANGFVLSVYQTTKSFPREELYGVTSQLRRASLSVAVNIVEGHASTSTKDFLNFLNISNKSLVESEYLLEVARALDYLTEQDYKNLESLRKEVSIILFAFTRSIKSLL